MSQISNIHEAGQRHLKAGALDILYERGFLRYIRYGQTELLRMIYFALRDHNWDTMAGEIVNEQVQTSTDGFRISYVWKSLADNFPFEWKVEIEGFSDQKIVFSIDGVARGSFRKNRTGFCILHPIKECSGAACTIIHPDGRRTEGSFPLYISPHQPFKEIQAIVWNPDSMGTATIMMAGDVFEMEDQRNWTDDSFKTYCTPLDLPFPVVMKAGDQVKQKVLISFQPDESPVPAASGEMIKLKPGKAMDRIPAIGISASPHKARLSETELAFLREIPWSHYRIEVRLFESGWEDYLRSATQIARELSAAIELVAICSDQWRTEVKLLFAVWQSIPNDKLSKILCLHQLHKTTPAALIEAFLHVFENDSSVLIGAGTNAYFTELNREPPPVEGLDFISYSINPQVHAFDDLSLTETLEAQAYTVESARKLYPAKAIHVSPVTLKPRFNPNATGPDPESNANCLPAQVDLRQNTLFGAGWTLGSILHLARAEVDLITYFEATGWKGIMQGDDMPPDKELFPVEPGDLYPMYHVFRLLLKARDSVWVPLESEDSLKIQGLLLDQGDKSQIILANHQDHKIWVQIQLPIRRYRILTLDADSVEISRMQPDFWDGLGEKHEVVDKEGLHVALEAHAIACLRIEM